MKNIKKGLLTCLLSISTLLTVGLTTSCSAFFGDDGYLITDITHYVDANGNVVVTINFDSDEVDPLTLTIPKGNTGEDGLDGAGISNIEANKSEDGNSIDIVISYTDNRLPTTINVPIVNGEDGRGIDNVIVDQDEEGNTTLQFEYSDGTNSSVFTIPKAQDGRGIQSITSQSIVGTNVTIITISYTDGNSDQFQIQNGVGIDSITYSEELSTETAYALVINYTDSNSETIYLPKPEATRWYTGASDPNQSLGNNGDFYLNLSSGEVFLKQNNNWVAQFNMKGDSESSVTSYYNVTFTLGEGESWVNEELGSGTIIQRVEEGSTISLENIPTPKKDNSIFEGWYTSKEVNVNSGKFTDLTVITKNITLYAHWSENI